VSAHRCLSGATSWATSLPRSSRTAQACGAAPLLAELQGDSTLDRCLSEKTVNLDPLLVENSELNLITTLLTAGIMTLSAPLPLDRVHLLNRARRLGLAER
jgi:hypothetical protein